VALHLPPQNNLPRLEQARNSWPVLRALEHNRLLTLHGLNSLQGNRRWVPQVLAV